LEKGTPNVIQKIYLSFLILICFFAFSDFSKAEETNNEVEDEVFEIVGGSVVESEEDVMLVREGLDGKVRLGGAGVALSRDTFKFGEYTGIDDDGGFAVADADLRYFRDSYYLDFTADNLGLENRKINLEAGIMDNISFFAEYDQTPHLLFSRNKTPFEGVGSQILTLPSNFSQQSTFSTSPLTGGNGVDLEIDDRETATFGLSKKIGLNQFDLVYKRINKEGLNSLGGIFGTSGANPRSIILPAAIDNVTNEITASLAHNSDTYQFQFDYFGSLFNNRQSSLAFANPYTGLLPFSADFLPDGGLISRQPDNQYHRFSFSGGWDFSETTRITALAEYGLSKQDEDLLAFGLGSSRDLLPRQTADAQIETYHISIKATAKPFSNLGLTAKYRFYATDNTTPKTLFLPIVNDTGSQVTTSSARAESNLPFQYTQNQFKLDAVYRIFKMTNLNLGYVLDVKNREFRAVDEIFENKFKAGIRTNYKSLITARVNFAFSNRHGDNYDPARITINRHTKDFLDTATSSSLTEPIPELRRFDVANQERFQLNGNVSVFVNESTTLGLSYNLNDIDYDDTQIGLKESMNQDITLDLSYSPSETTNLYSYYTFDEGQSEQIGRAHNFFVPGASSDPTRNWQANLDDNSYTAGVGGNWKFLENKVTLQTDYVFSESITNYTFGSGTNTAVANPEDLPDLKTTLHRWTTTGEYQWSPTLSFGLSYWYENFSYEDFALDSFGPQDSLTSTFTEVVLLSDTIQSYEAHVGMLFATCKFEM
jgi:MtrB/PioB family decaheme-associated outer membrane protein